MAQPVIDRDEVEHRFRNHPPINDDVAAKGKTTRDEFIRLGETLARTLPDSREKSLAFTALEESSFWAQAAIARNQMVAKKEGA